MRCDMLWLAANRIIFCEPPKNYTLFTQAMGRVHRLGQEFPQQVDVLYAENVSIELEQAKFLQRERHRLDLLDQVC